ncbi:MAG TPA: hypothetical protein VI072_36420 [Polyangiaceae bacterium]
MRVANVCHAVFALVALPSCTAELGDWSPRDINEHGVIVGDRLNRGFPYVAGAVVYRGNGPLVDLEPHEADAVASANAISNDGTIVGISFLPTPTSPGPIAVYWDRTGAVHAIPALGGDPTPWMMAMAINGRGLIAGFSIAPPPPGAQPVMGGRPWIFDKASGVLTELPTLTEPNYSRAHSINDAGEVVGYADAGGVSWAAGTHEPRALPRPEGASYAVPYAINASGAIVGTMYTDTGDYFPVLWPTADSMPTQLPLGRCTVGDAAAINDSGVIVGTLRGADGCSGPSNPSADGSLASYAVRWNAAGVLSDLGNPNSRASSINAYGTAVGDEERLGTTGVSVVRAMRWP